MSAGCARCAALAAAARLTLTPETLQDLDDEAERSIEFGDGAALAMLLQFYRNVKAAFANGVRGADQLGGADGQ